MLVLLVRSESRSGCVSRRLEHVHEITLVSSTPGHISMDEKKALITGPIKLSLRSKIWTFFRSRSCCNSFVFFKL